MEWLIVAITGALRRRKGRGGLGVSCGFVNTPLSPLDRFRFKTIQPLVIAIELIKLPGNVSENGWVHVRVCK